MKTQREAQAEHVNYLLPPLSLTFTFAQQHRNRVYLDVRCHSGSHQFLHRELDVFYDHFDAVPAMVGSSMLSWTLWLVQFEQERREQSSGKHRQGILQFPDWPSPQAIYGVTKPEEF